MVPDVAVRARMVVVPDVAVRARMIVVPDVAVRARMLWCQMWLQERGCCGARCGCKSEDVVVPEWL